jgi:hypothetical protein
LQVNPNRNLKRNLNKHLKLHVEEIKKQKFLSKERPKRPPIMASLTKELPRHLSTGTASAFSTSSTSATTKRAFSTSRMAFSTITASSTARMNPHIMNPLDTGFGHASNAGSNYTNTNGGGNRSAGEYANAHRYQLHPVPDASGELPVSRTKQKKLLEKATKAPSDVKLYLTANKIGAPTDKVRPQMSSSTSQRIR